MSPTAKMPGMLVWNFSVSTSNLLALDAQAPFGDRAELGAQAEEHQQHVQRHARVTPSPPVTLTPLSRPSVVLGR
jgi:hypothetical protein